MNELSKEAIVAIDCINDDIIEFCGISEEREVFYFVSCTSDGENLSIDWLGEMLWRSSEDEREFDGEYEAIEDFVRRKMKRKFTELKELNFVFCKKFSKE